MELSNIPPEARSVELRKSRREMEDKTRLFYVLAQNGKSLVAAEAV